MPSRRLAAILRRKQHLVARAALDRLQVGLDAVALERPLSAVDRGLAAALYLRHHPRVLMGGALATVVLFRFNVVGLLARGLVAWRTYRTLARWTGALATKGQRRLPRRRLQ
jgi:hypothetical protein